MGLAPVATRQVMLALSGEEASVYGDYCLIWTQVMLALSGEEASAEGIDMTVYEAKVGAYFHRAGDRGGDALLYRALRSLLHAARVTPCGVLFEDAATTAYRSLAQGIVSHYSTYVHIW